MAFPVPSHLPKRAVPVDVSSKILYKLDAATNITLDATLSASWIRELDESIQATKESIHNRITSDLPTFNTLQNSANVVQTRFHDFTQRLDTLDGALSHPETGLVPRLLTKLQTHKAVAQEASDNTAIYESYSYLLSLRNEYSELVSLAGAGNLPEATLRTKAIGTLLDVIPKSLDRATVMTDFKSKFRAAKNRVEDQLNDAYSRAIVVKPSELVVLPSVTVRRTQVELPLASVISSLPEQALSTHLTTFRRDFVSYFIDHVLKQPYAVETFVSNTERKLVLIPAPPNTEVPSSRLSNLSKVLAFLRDTILSQYPKEEAAKFMRSLSKIVAQSVLNNLLIPLLPGSFGLLPAYLSLLKEAVSFEENVVVKLLDGAEGEDIIKSWSHGVSGHYERRRRVEILDQARQEILSRVDLNETFQAVSNDSIETSLPSVVPVQDDDDMMDDGAWGLDEPLSAAPVESTPDAHEDKEGDGWGLDDDMDTEETPEPSPASESTPVEHTPTGDVDADVNDAWGWNEDADEGLSEDIPEDNAWDDPWNDPPPDPEPVPVAVAAKSATRLEKLASKNKKALNGSSQPLVIQPEPASKPVPAPPPPKIVLNNGSSSAKSHEQHRPPAVMVSVAPKEYYQVPKHIKRVIKMVDASIDESKLFYASNLFPNSMDMKPAPGSILAQSASSILDLYEALYPIKYASDPAAPEKGMLFANSCQYMAGAIQKVEDTIYGESTLKERLTESRKRLEILSSSWYDDVIESQQRRMVNTLSEGVQGFAFLADQDRYDECEMALSQVASDIKKLAHKLNGVLAKSRYYTALGLVTEATLSKILEDILAFSDIPEVESHRLAELCRIMNSVEGLFSEDSSQPSFVVAYVPSWFKFSYLSELLEASLADITYLFDQGALVDFKVPELVSLVRALFADTQLRANTINKILAGHPAPSH